MDAPPPGRRGRRWSFDAAIPLMVPPSKSVPIPKRGRSRSVVGPESIFAPPPLAEKHHGFLHQKLQKNWRKFQQRRNSFSLGHRDFIVLVTYDDESTDVLTGGHGRSVKEVLNSAGRMELRISSYRVIMSSSRSSLPNFTSTMSMSESLEDLLEEFPDGNNLENSDATDGRYASLHNLLESERVYQQNLRTIYNAYAEPLRKFSALSKDEHKLLFSPVEPILSISIMLCSKLEDALRQWDPGTACMGSLFSKKIWQQYEEYISSSREAREYIKEKRKADEPFAEFCELRRGSQDQLSLDELLLLPVKRLPRYEHHLKELLEETDESHPDFEDLTRALERVKEMVVEHDVIGDGASDMDTIQDRFPYDDLQLSKKEQPMLSGLQRRRRSAPSALLFKTLGSSRSRSAGNLSSTTTAPFRKDDFLQSARLSSNRYFVKEGPVQLTLQGQTQERYLFLFSDVLLIAKPKSGSTFKLKQRLNLSTLWIGTCVEEVADLPRCLQQSFVLGWPLTNQAVTCVSVQDKEAWLQTLQNQIEEERKKVEHREISIGVYGGEDFDQMKEIQINIRQDARDILKLYIDKCHMSESEAKDYQLWVMPSPEDSSFPLIGHEIPYSICSRGEEVEGETTQCRFFLKNKKVGKRHGLDDRKQKGKTLFSLFKRSSRDSTEIGQTTKMLFGQPLESVMVDEELPKSVMTLLSVLCRSGPTTQGILRKSPNEKVKKELKQRLDEGEDCITDETPTHVVGALVKDYLRSLPESLLLEDQYDNWVNTDDINNTNEKISCIKQLTWQLPACNLVLLKHLMCILYHIDKHSEWNSMDAYNLSICLAQSMLRSKGTGTVQPEQAKKANSVLQFMIENCVEIFGEEVTMLLEYIEDKADSGTDTDSIPETNGNLRRDDSSIDSLEKDDPRDMESSPRIAKSHLSPVNLSNDSGVTLSDSQLVSDEGPYNDHRSLMYRRQINYRSSSSESLRPVHTSVGKRCSADSLCSVEESSEHEGEDRHDLRQRRTFGAIIKSASGDHLYPLATDRHSCETHSDSEIQSAPRERLVRQTSVNSSTPPLSPQPKLSYSSDSLLSDSSASYLRETTGFGDAPNTPPHNTSSHSSYSQTLTVNHHPKQKLQKSSSGGATPSDPFPPPHSLKFNQRRYSDESIKYHVSPPNSPIASSPRQRSPSQQGSSPPNHRHSIHMFVSPNGHSHSPAKPESSVQSHPPLSLTVRSEDVTDSSPPKNINPRPTWRFSEKQIITGSPPPRILLQTYRDQRGQRGVQSSSGPRLITHSRSKPELSPSDFKDYVPSHNMESRIVSVTRKQHSVIRIKTKSANKQQQQSEPDGPNYLSQVTVRARPQYPPSYLEALDRKDRLSKGLPVDVSLQDTLSQKRASAHAKQLYEQSVRQFMSDAPSQTSTLSSHSSSSEEDDDFRPDKDPKQVYEESMRQFLEQQSGEKRRVSLDTSSGVSRSNSEDYVGGYSTSRVTVNAGNHGYTSHNHPDKMENRTVIHIPSVRDSKLFEARNKELPSGSTSYSRSPRHSMPSSSRCFYDPKGQSENNVSSTVVVSHRPSTGSKLDTDVNKYPRNKSYLSWSVADLRRHYDESKARSEASEAEGQRTHIVTVGSRTPTHQQTIHRPPPPPYQPPPPFRRNSSDVERKGSSRSNSSEDSGSTSHSVRRIYQPQHL